MRTITSLPIKDRKNIFLKTAYELGISEPLIVEKDFWVSWLLEKLFDNNESQPALIFKGGTSLSKAYNIINRFSEDIDLTIDRKSLGFIESDEAIIEMGSKKRKRYFETLNNKTLSAINENIVPFLENSIANDLNEKWSLTIDPYNSERLIFSYPNCFDVRKNNYLLSSIILEFGSRGDTTPTENIDISTYVNTALPNLNIETPNVNVLKPERTFLEKILILHKIAHQPDEKPIQARLSRHYYDVVMLSKNKKIDRAMTNSILLKKVASHNIAYFRSAQASYETATSGTLKLIPKDVHIKSLEHDYKMMGNMFINELFPFDEIIDSIKKLEDKLNLKTQ